MRLIKELRTNARPRNTLPKIESASEPLCAQDVNVVRTGAAAPMTAASRRYRAANPWRRRHVLAVVGLTALGLVLTSSSAHADTVVLALAASVDEVLNNIRNWIMGIAAGVATVFMSIGGARRMTGGGDPAEIEKSKIAFKSAGMGYGLAALAPLAVEILKGIVGA